MVKKIVLAIGGNSLIKDEKHESVKDQYEQVVQTCKHIVKLIKLGHRVVITHGNGPQVGFILRRSELAKSVLHMVPIDSCVADTQGAIGYNIQMALQNEFKRNNIKKEVVTVVTQVEIDPEDPTLKKPTKPIGYFMTEEEAIPHIEEDGWVIAQDAGRGYRRMVSSPKPKKIVEIETIRHLLEKDIVVIAVGGGGIPVSRDEAGEISGIEGVIDKDLASCLLAKEIKADMLVISTAVDKVYLNWNKPNKIAVDKMSVSEALKYIEEGHFAPGSMLPKIQAIVDFVKSTNATGLITSPEKLAEAFNGKTGTIITV